MPGEAKIRAIIVDDEAPARSRIRQLVKHEADFEIVADCSNGRQAVEVIRREKPDLAFLDVQMPGLTGMEVCETLAAADLIPPLVIFVTAYDAYALKAFEVHALDYLLKPFDRERFKKAIGRAREQLVRVRAGGADPRLAALLEDLRAGVKRADRLVLKENGRVIFVSTETIDWIEADGNYVRLHAGAESHYVRDTLAGMETQLPRENFMRISRSLLVNLDRVKELQPHFYGDYVVILRDGSKLNMTRNYRDRLEAILARRP
ncbi:MAG TPA: LytTR family DNA-binding domain-containing protein [Candidatus Acidoferrum sp.]|jgi:two-component system LytT family response regulator|nr:LytTR family DNA-binding domain-containing protein [Candidatus Acidoferrum sp.]